MTTCQPQPLRSDVVPSEEPPAYLHGDILSVLDWRIWVALCQIGAVDPQRFRKQLHREPDDLARPPCGTCVFSHLDEHVTPARHPGPCEVGP